MPGAEGPYQQLSLLFPLPLLLLVILLLRLLPGPHLLPVLPPSAAGDGGDYWSPGGNNGGNLPFQTVDLNAVMQFAGVLPASFDLVGFYMDNYIVNGSYSTGTW